MSLKELELYEEWLRPLGCPAWRTLSSDLIEPCSFLRRGSGRAKSDAWKGWPGTETRQSERNGIGV